MEETCQVTVKGSLEIASATVTYVHDANIRTYNASSFFEKGKEVVREHKGANVTDVRCQNKKLRSP